jgi:hypothetical protein
MTRKGKAAPRNTKSDDVVAQTNSGPLSRFICNTASSVILHPKTGTVLLRGVRGEVKEARPGTELYELLKHAAGWHLEGSADAVVPVSHRRFVPRPTPA